MGHANTTKADLLAAAVLVVAATKLTFALQNFMDINFTDETYYLTCGVRLLSNGLPPPENGPLYAVWYFLLSFLQPDPLRLYYLNYQILTALVPLLFYFLLRRLTLSPLAALLTSAYFLVSFANLPSWPKSAHFALLIILPILIASTYIRSFTLATLCLALGALLSSYARPEFFVTYVLFAILYFLLLARGFKSGHLAREVPALGGFLVVSALVLALFGSPVLMGESRSFLAFRHFFSLNWVTWTGSDMLPFAEYEKIVTQQFGQIDSVLGALASNPILFLQHAAYNAIRIPVVLGKTIFLHYSVVLPVESKTSWVIEGALVLVAVVVYLFSSVNRSSERIRKVYQECKRPLFYAALYSVPGFVSAAVFLPKRYYLLMPAILCLVVLAVYLFGRAGGRVRLRTLALTGILIVGLTPCLCQYGGGGSLTLTGRMDNVETAKFVRSLGITQRVTMLTDLGRHHVYAGDNYHCVRPDDTAGSLLEMLEEQKINMILFSDELRKHPRFREDEGWGLFLGDCEAFGYKQMPIPNTYRCLFVREDLLPHE